MGGDVLCEENIMQRSPDITIHAPLERLGRLVINGNYKYLGLD